MTVIQKRITTVLFLIVAAFGISSCKGQTPSIPEDTPQIQILGPENPYEAVKRIESTSNTNPVLWSEKDSRLDNQGAVEIEISPLNLKPDRETLDFNVSLNTHSIDLSMDLVPLSTLETDTGNIVQSLSWDGPLGGHHIAGTLSFPAELNGVSILAEVTQMVITIKDVDAAERIFVWER